jgi:adenylate cyclase
VGVGLARVRRIVSASWSARLAGTGLLAALVAVRVWDPVPVDVLRLRTFDLYQAIQPRDRSDSRVAIVDIDDRSLREIGQWPWPRTQVAELVVALARAGAVAVAFDVIFAEPDRLSPDRLAGRLLEDDPEIAERLSALPPNDRVLAGVMRQWRVVLAQAAHPERLEPGRDPPGKATVARMGGDPEPFLVAGAGVLRNVPVLEEAAKGVGMVSLWPSPDNVVRRVPLMIHAGGGLHPGLALELLRVATGEKTYLIRTSRAGVDRIGMGAHAIPTDRNGRFWVYYGRSDPGQYVSARDLLAGEAPAGALRGKLVFVGTSATGLRDLRATPLNAALPGVEVHAQALETVLSNRQLSRPAYAEGLEILATIFAGLSVVLLVPALGPLGALAAGGVVALGIAGGSFYAFAERLLLLDPSYALVSSFLVFSLMVFTSYVREQSQRRFVRNAFSRYLAPALVDQVTRDPGALALGGEQRETTVMFADVRGFTEIAERYGDDAQGLTALINSFLTPLSRQVLRHRGTIDKYMGDAIMAFWNAPVRDGDHPGNACRAALAMIEALDGLNRELAASAEAAGRAPVALRVGVGVNTGVCVAGNLGSEEQFNYSVLGDSVNLASRFEALTRYYGVSILVGDGTRQAVGARMALVEVDLIRVKGRSRPARVHALLGDADRRGPEFDDLAAAHARMLDAYRGRRWAAARSALDEARRAGGRFGLGALHDLYAGRIDDCERRPPPPDWDGVYTAAEKSFTGLARPRRMRFERGDTIFEAGAPGGSAFLIISGKVTVVADGDVELAELGPGDLLGEMSFLDRQARSAAARATDTAELVEIEADALLEALGGSNTDAAAFVAGLVGKLRATNRRLVAAERAQARNAAWDP